MEDRHSKKSLDQKIDDHNNARIQSTENDNTDEGLTVNERPAETQNAVSHKDGDNWGENRVSTSINED